MEPDKIDLGNYPDVYKFLDLFENKGVYKISPEANNIPSPYRQIRVGLTYRSPSLAGMLGEAIDLFKKSPIMYGSDLRKVITVLKTHGVLLESDGLAKKYDDCLKDYNKKSKEYDELKADYDELSERSEKVLTDKTDLVAKNRELKLEIETLRMQAEEK